MDANQVERTRTDSQQMRIERFISSFARIFDEIVSEVEQEETDTSEFDSLVSQAADTEKCLSVIADWFEASAESLVYAATLLDKLLSTGIQLSKRNRWNLFGVSLVLALKMLDDTVFNNKHYAQCMCLPLDQ